MSSSEGTDPPAPAQIILVLIQHEVLGEDVGVGETLEDAVDEAGVAVVPDSYHPRDAALVIVKVTPPLS